MIVDDAGGAAADLCEDDGLRLPQTVRPSVVQLFPSLPSSSSSGSSSSFEIASLMFNAVQQTLILLRQIPQPLERLQRLLAPADTSSSSTATVTTTTAAPFTDGHRRQQQSINQRSMAYQRIVRGASSLVALETTISRLMTAKQVQVGTTTLLPKIVAVSVIVGSLLRPSATVVFLAELPSLVKVEEETPGEETCAASIMPHHRKLRDTSPQCRAALRQMFLSLSGIDWCAKGCARQVVNVFISSTCDDDENSSTNAHRTNNKAHSPSGTAATASAAGGGNGDDDCVVVETMPQDFRIPLWHVMEEQEQQQQASSSAGEMKKSLCRRGEGRNRCRCAVFAPEPMKQLVQQFIEADGGVRVGAGAVPAASSSGGNGSGRTLSVELSRSVLGSLFKVQPTAAASLLQRGNSFVEAPSSSSMMKWVRVFPSGMRGFTVPPGWT